MREIKFRAWNKKGVYADTMVYQDGPDLDGVIYYTATVDGQDIYYNFEDIMDEREFTLMQYTGLKDMNGVEIYEGDIVTDTEYLGEVLFHDRWYEVGMHSGKLAWCVFDRRIGEYITLGDCDDEETWGIIGNIYENGDLLNEK